MCSEQPAILEVILNDHIRNCIEDKLDISRVCGASEVGVDLFEVALGISASVQ